MQSWITLLRIVGLSCFSINVDVFASSELSYANLAPNHENDLSWEQMKKEAEFEQFLRTIKPIAKNPCIEGEPIDSGPKLKLSFEGIVDRIFEDYPAEADALNKALEKHLNSSAGMNNKKFTNRVLNEILNLAGLRPVTATQIQLVALLMIQVKAIDHIHLGSIEKYRKLGKIELTARNSLSAYREVAKTQRVLKYDYQVSGEISSVLKSFEKAGNGQEDPLRECSSLANVDREDYLKPVLLTLRNLFVRNGSSYKTCYFKRNFKRLRRNLKCADFFMVKETDLLRMKSNKELLESSPYFLKI